MTIEKQVRELNNEIRCTLKPSKIHGIGVFTLRDIKKGEKLYSSPDEYKMYEIPFKKLTLIRPEICKIIVERWPLVIKGYPFESPNNVRLTSFMNHSDTPNSKDDFALMNIEEGEEVTEDYRIVPNAEKIYKFL